MRPQHSTDIRATFMLIAAALALSACGGGGGGGGGLTATSAPSPTNGQFALSQTVNGRSQLSGSAARVSQTGATTGTATQVQGTYVHNTQALTLNDGSYNFSDQNGPVGGTLYDDGSAIVDTLVNIQFSTFDFVFPYIQGYRFGGQDFFSYGAVGIATNAANVPSTGTASFTGVSFGQINSSLLTAPKVDYFAGNATVSADFGAGQVDVAMGITSTIDINGNATIAPIDAISIDNMSITGAAFSGGKLTTSLGGVGVNVTGAGTVTTAQGQFYSATGSAPDEVGGSVVSQGNNGLVAAAFIAD